MKRIWRPFCLEMLSRRIMCARDPGIRCGALMPCDGLQHRALWRQDHFDVRVTSRIAPSGGDGGTIVFIIFCGLPGAGKTTLARELAGRLGAVYLRIDTIERALAPAEDVPVGEAGCRVGYAVAADNLRLGRTVVADSVNPLRITRDAWRDVAKRAGVIFVEVLVVCCDPIVHRHRVETRKTEIAGLTLPTWQDVLTREFEPWDREHVVIDTAGQTVEQSMAALQATVLARRRS